MDLIDKKILYQLDKNCRASYNQIAKNIRSSRNVVVYRIRKLEKDKVIRGYFTEINNTALGYTGFRVLIKYSNYDLNQEKLLIEYITKDKRIAWCMSAAGKWDLDVIYWCENRFEFSNLLDELKAKYNHLIEQIEHAVIVDIYHYKKDYLVSTKRISQRKKFGETTVNLNEDEKKVLKSIAFNSNKSVIEIYKDTGLSINTIKKYLNRLIEKNIILSFRPFIDINSIGYQYYRLHLTLKDYTSNLLSSLKTFLETDIHVAYLDFYIGGADIEIEYHIPKNMTINDKFQKVRELFGAIIKEYVIIEFTKEHIVRYIPEK